MAYLLIVDEDVAAGASLAESLQGMGHTVTVAATSNELPPDWLASDLPTATERLERTLIEHALAASRGNRAETARRLGIHRQLLYRKLARYGMS